MMFSSATTVTRLISATTAGGKDAAGDSATMTAAVTSPAVPPTSMIDSPSATIGKSIF